MNIFDKFKKKLEDKPVMNLDSIYTKSKNLINPLHKNKPAAQPISFHESKETLEHDKSVKDAKDLDSHKKTGNYSRFDKKKAPRRKLMQIIAEFIGKMGIEENPRELNKKILLWDVRILGFISIILLLYALFNRLSFDVVITFLIIFWTVLFIALYLASILAFMLYLDIQLYNRTKQIEEALPDYLQLTAANISAGMTIDRALWYAVRPKFGILAKEMEDVAKSTITGEELESALIRLTKKYNSRVLKESINLIVAGLSSGGEMAGLLTKIGQNIKESSLIKKEIAASVMTYVIFIVSATIIAAPILFALSTELLTVIREITSKIHLDNSSGVSGLFSFNFSGDSISIDSFRRFSMLVLVISSTFTAAITSTIRKGSVKDGARFIPIFIAVSMVIYLIFTSIFGSLLSGMFG